MDTKIKICPMDSYNMEWGAPTFAKPGDAGLDLRYAGSKAIRIHPNQLYKIPTGLKFALPDGLCGLVMERSGLAINYGIEILGRVLDSGYRGELFVGMTMGSAKTKYDATSSDYPVDITNIKIEPGDRIAQIVFVHHYNNIELVDNESLLGETDRGASGIGSTGVK